MKFTPISIDEYVKMYLVNNPTHKEVDLRNDLNFAINAYQKGVKCSCGNDVWVIGSAALGMGCFTCITGKNYPTDEHEIDTVIKKRENIKGRKHIDDFGPINFGGFFDDDGFEINTDLIKKPSLCLLCNNDDNPEEEILCNMTRYDQKEEEEFKCFAFCKK